jgi:hypothetical protein
LLNGLNSDVKLVIGGGIGIAVLAWCLKNADNIKIITGAGASGYADAVHALEPT